MTVERDIYGFAVEQADRMEEVMRRLYDLGDGAEMAGFSSGLVEELNAVRLKFLDEYQANFPGHGTGRSVWR